MTYRESSDGSNGGLLVSHVHEVEINEHLLEALRGLLELILRGLRGYLGGARARVHVDSTNVPKPRVDRLEGRPRICGQ